MERKFSNLNEGKQSVSGSRLWWTAGYDVLEKLKQVENSGDELRDN